MLQPSPVPATPFIERLRTGAGRRTLAVALALLIEGLLLLLLLSFGSEKRPGAKEQGITVLNVPIEAVADDAPELEERPSSQPQPPSQARQEPRPAPPAEPLPRQPADRIPAPVAPAVIPAPRQPPSIPVPRRSAPPAQSGGAVYGPPDTGRSSAFRDTERVGTAPNGEPLYAADWYREPDPAALGAYLSTARNNGWGLIACRTAPDYRVEDCVPLTEYPEGSMINRSILAAAWEFKVRPPQRGGRPLVGSWVRIRIDYSIGPR